ncbi:MAG: ParA family protein, partial [Nocardioides sp.]
MKVLATCNQKGGVGKTTTARNLARAAIQQGRRTLVVDLDPQGNLTSVLSVEEMPDDVAGVADALSD